MKIKFLDVMSWIFLVATVALLFWYMFGDSPTEIIIYSGISGFVLVKMWNFNSRLIGLEMKTKHGFVMMKKDMDLIKGDVGLLKDDMKFVRGDLSFIKGKVKR